MSSKIWTLRQVTEFEGSGKPLEEMLSCGSEIRMTLALDVRTKYRPARALLRSPDTKEQGVEGMRSFVQAAMSTARAAEQAGDFAAAMLAKHNAASAAGWFDKEQQCQINREVLASASLLPDGKDRDFILDKCFWALVENDPSFSISVEQVAVRVLSMEVNQFPDFPGRAMRLAKHLLESGDRETAISWLQRAVRAEFGKADQRAEAEVLLNRLLK